MRRLLLAAPLLFAPPAAAADHAGLSVTVAKGHADFRADKHLVARYHFAESVAKPYFWPVHSPDNVAVTRAWPLEKGTPGETTDHVHHKSVWFCHGDVVADGVTPAKKSKHAKGVDFWTEEAPHGKEVCVGVEEPRRHGPNHVALRTRNEWRSADGHKVLDETRTIHLFEVAGVPLLVVDSDLTATAGAVTFEDTKEGSFGVRVHDKIAGKTGKGTLTNAEGKVGEKAVWGHPSKWCDYSGVVDGKAAGIAVLDGPENPAVSCWHAREYGLMAANPFGRGKSGFPAMKGRTDLLTIAKGATLRFRYGLYPHAGDVKAGNVAGVYEAFAKLPR